MAVGNPTIAALRAATAPSVAAPQGPQALSFAWQRNSPGMTIPTAPSRSTASSKSAPPVSPPTTPTPPVVNPYDPYARFRNDPTAVLPGGGGMALPVAPTPTAPVAPPSTSTPPSSRLEPAPFDYRLDPGFNDFNDFGWNPATVMPTQPATPTQPAAPAPAPVAAPTQQTLPTPVQPLPSNPMLDPGFNDFNWDSWFDTDIAQPASPAPVAPAAPTQQTQPTNPYAFNWDEISFLGLDPSAFMVPGVTLPQQTAPQPAPVQQPVEEQRYQPSVPWWYWDQGMLA